ncbi:unnamed protein product, partial [Prorocentrum cordatum]
GARLGGAGAAPERPELPPRLEEALLDFEGDFRGPWRALGLEADAVGLEVSQEEVRAAYRVAVRSEHPDTSEFPDAEERFQRVRKAYALLSDDGTRALLAEALEQEVQSFEALERDLAEEEPPSRGGLRAWQGLALLSAGLALAAGRGFSEGSQSRRTAALPCALRPFWASG